MPELGQVSDEIAAALIGVAPYDDDSGKRRGERTSRVAAAGSVTPSTCPVWRSHAEQSRPEAYYQRLIAKGKSRRLAIIACMRKLIVILNTMIARRQKWDPTAMR